MRVQRDVAWRRTPQRDRILKGITMRELTGKVALVTGASKGIGAQIAESLGLAGAAVAVNYATDETGAARVVEKIKQGGGRALALQGSVVSNADAERLFVGAEKTFGKVNVLVNNAGVYKFAPHPAFTAKDFEWMFNTNVRGLLRTSQEAVRRFGGDDGTIINIGSVVTYTHPPYSSMYTATTGAVRTITGALARELGPRVIRLDPITSSAVRTKGIRTVGVHEQEVTEEIRTETPLGHVSRSKNYGAVAVFLASSGSHWMTGKALEMAGRTRCVLCMGALAAAASSPKVRRCAAERVTCANPNRLVGSEAT